MVHRIPHFVLALSFMFPIGAAAQEAPDAVPVPASETIKVDTEMVLLDAIVADKEGRLVTDLSASDFEVYDNKLRQEIAYFRQGGLPASIMLILDMHAGCCNGHHDTMLRSVAGAIGHLAPDDQVAVMTVGGERKLVVDFTKDKEQASQVLGELAALELFWGMTLGNTLNQAVLESIQSLSKAKARSGRRFLVLVSPRCTAGGMYRFKGASRRQVLRRLHESGIVVSRLIVNNFIGNVMDKMGRYHPYLFALRKLSGAAELSKYVKRTGGVIVKVDKDKMADRLSGLFDRVKRSYSLGYYPNGLRRDGSFHRIRLKQSRASKESRGKLAVKTRRGYYATQASAGQARLNEIEEVMPADTGTPPPKR